MIQKINPIKIFLLCPIPEEQKPIYEYINMKKFFEKTKNKKFKEKKQNFFLFLNTTLSKIFFIIRLKEIEKNFSQPIVFYEEGSWYDGQIWQKSLSIIKNDRLLNSQIVQARQTKENIILFLAIFFFNSFLLTLFLFNFT
jgi:hypothetical protein